MQIVASLQWMRRKSKRLPSTRQSGASRRLSRLSPLARLKGRSRRRIGGRTFTHAKALTMLSYRSHFILRNNRLSVYGQRHVETYTPFYSRRFAISSDSDALDCARGQGSRRADFCPSRESTHLAAIS